MRKNIIFICHGNICRSPAAEIIFNSKLTNQTVISRAISYEEIGNEIYPYMQKALIEKGYVLSHHKSTHISKEEYNNADYIFYMDENNHRLLINAFGESKKFQPIYGYSKSIKEIEDPWYTGNFKKVISELEICIDDIIRNLFSDEL